MKVGDLTRQGQSDQLPIPYINIFTRDLSIGGGTQSITGIGFKPSGVLFFSVIGSTDFASWGFDTSTQNGGIDHFNDNDAFGSIAGANTPIRFSNAGAGMDIGATITSLDSDGFTLTWTVLSGSPTGTATIIFIAFK